MLCKKCGNDLPDNAKFCDRCGTPQIGLDMSGISSDKEKTNKPDSGTSNTGKLRKYLLIGIVGIIALVIIIAVVFSYVGQGADFVATQKSTDTTNSGALTPIPTPPQTPVLKTVLFSDDLSRWRSEWDEEYDYYDGKIFYSGGFLHIRDNQPPEGTLYQTLNKNYNDFILDVDTKTVDGTLDNYQGVFVRGNTEENYYAFLISADGYYNIQKMENDKLVNLVSPTRTSYINTGTGVTNHIHIEVNKNTISLSVNGNHVRTVTDNTFEEGTVSLVACCLTSNSFTEVVFSNLVITTI